MSREAANHALMSIKKQLRERAMRKHKPVMVEEEHVHDQENEPDEVDEMGADVRHEARLEQEHEVMEPEHRAEPVTLEPEHPAEKRTVLDSFVPRTEPRREMPRDMPREHGEPVMHHKKGKRY